MSWRVYGGLGGKRAREAKLIDQSDRGCDSVMQTNHSSGITKTANSNRGATLARLCPQAESLCYQASLSCLASDDR